LCEDSNLCGSQHSPEPTKDIAKLQELCRASRPYHQAHMPWNILPGQAYVSQAWPE